MLNLSAGNTAQRFIVTLSERVTLINPYYLFVFEQVTTKDQYSFIIPASGDLSQYPDRYNEFQIDMTARFANAKEGDYRYSVYEQSSPSNTNPSNATTLLEVGQMKLDVQPDRSYTKYSQAQTYKVYNGAS